MTLFCLRRGERRFVPGPKLKRLFSAFCCFRRLMNENKIPMQTKSSQSSFSLDFQKRPPGPWVGKIFYDQAREKAKSL